jgi:hypothetical protein
MNSWPELQAASGTADASAKQADGIVDFGRRSATYTNGS